MISSGDADQHLTWTNTANEIAHNNPPRLYLGKNSAKDSQLKNTMA